MFSNVPSQNTHSRGPGGLYEKLWCPSQSCKNIQGKSFWWTGTVQCLVWFVYLGHTKCDFQPTFTTFTAIKIIFVDHNTFSWCFATLLLVRIRIVWNLLGAPTPQSVGVGCRPPTAAARQDCTGSKKFKVILTPFQHKQVGGANHSGQKCCGIQV